MPVEGSRERRYLRDDVERLRARRDARSGHGPVAAGALRWGEPVLDSAITRIDERGFHYRGRDAIELATSGVSFERVAELLWTGTFPDRAGDFGADALIVDGEAAVPELAAALPDGARPLDAPMLALPVMAASDPDRHARTIEHQRALVRRLAASFALPRGAACVTEALHASSIARALAIALGGRSRARDVAAIDRALVLCADHELNPSSFAARVAASAGADTYACVGAALATLSGPTHGGATERVEALVGGTESRVGAKRGGGPRAARSESPIALVRARLARGEPIPGFGHPLYADGDPRARPLLDLARDLAPRSSAIRTIDALVEAMALAGQPAPTVDLGLVAIARALRLPAGSALAIFATGRVAGWIAHVAEQREAAFLLRPRARYVGV
jgi:citrate synthase